jgi:hypothetical protein
MSHSDLQRQLLEGACTAESVTRAFGFLGSRTAAVLGRLTGPGSSAHPAGDDVIIDLAVSPDGPPYRLRVRPPFRGALDPSVPADVASMLRQLNGFSLDDEAKTRLLEFSRVNDSGRLVGVSLDVGGFSQAEWVDALRASPAGIVDLVATDQDWYLLDPRRDDAPTQVRLLSHAGPGLGPPCFFLDAIATTLERAADAASEAKPALPRVKNAPDDLDDPERFLTETNADLLELRAAALIARNEERARQVLVQRLVRRDDMFLTARLQNVLSARGTKALLLLIVEALLTESPETRALTEYRKKITSAMQVVVNLLGRLPADAQTGAALEATLDRLKGTPHAAVVLARAATAPPATRSQLKSWREALPSLEPAWAKLLQLG